MLRVDLAKFTCRIGNVYTSHLALRRVVFQDVLFVDKKSFLL